MTRMIRDIKIPKHAQQQAEPLLNALEQRSRAAVHKVRLHLERPNEFPIDRKHKSLEATLLDIIATAPPARRARLAGAATNQRLALVGPPLDFGLSLPIGDQIGLPFFDWQWFIPIFQGLEAPPAAPARNLELRVHSVRCIKDSREWGKDEIDLGGVLTVTEDVAGGAAKSVYAVEVSPFRVGSFKKGASINLQRRVLASLPVDSGTFPKVMSATLLLVEKDFSDQKWLISAIHKAKEWAEKQLKDQLKDKVDNSLLKEALAVALKIGLDAILKPVLGWVEDDPFDPATVTMLVAGRDAVADDGGRTTAPGVLDAFIHGGSDPHAHYQVTYDWNLVT
ncbi:hypothetical protein [Nannocystis sp.]|uniref:hypothetical protein n=1 Tax=Nannocystis sp. TaxID=1962667 RepID=UPI0025F37D0D|nr:hypothetical protein [Nannocystis sp.]MBK7826946.1 hypothetical protein [Nannocystis sp.]